MGMAKAFRGVIDDSPVVEEKVEPENVLLFILDSCRYDTFADAVAPNMRGVGELQRAWSPGFWTFPSLMCYLCGYGPIVGDAAEDRHLFSCYQPMIDRWAVRDFVERGYYTVFMSDNFMVYTFDTMLGGGLSRWFKHWSFTLDHRTLHDGPVHYVKRALGKPVFFVMLSLYTHFPYMVGEGVEVDLDPERPEFNYGNQVRSVEFADKLFGRLLEVFKELPRATEVIVTSDHGELFGPDHWGHNPKFFPLRFDEKLFEVPFIRGWVNR